MEDSIKMVLAVQEVVEAKLKYVKGRIEYDEYLLLLRSEMISVAADMGLPITPLIRELEFLPLPKDD